MRSNHMLRDSSAKSNPFTELIIKAVWPEFTPAVLGGQNTGYETQGLPYRVSRHPDAPAKTPFLKGIDPSSIRGYQSLYLVLPLAEDATPLLLGKAETDTPAQPLAWYRTLYLLLTVCSSLI